MAQYRQSGYTNTNSTNATTSINTHLFTNGAAATSSAAATTSADHIAIGVRSSHYHHHKKPRRVRSTRRISIGTAITVFCFVFAASAFAFLYFSTSDSTDDDTINVRDDAYKDDFLANVTRISTSRVKFGHGSVVHGRDSRYWDRDDRRRDEDYNEDEVSKSDMDGEGQSGKDHVPIRKSPAKKPDNNKTRGTDHHGFYNEAGRDELKMYEEKYEASLKKVDQSGERTTAENHASDDGALDVENEELDIDDEYDDGIDSHDSRLEDYDDSGHEVHSELLKSHSGQHDVGRLLIDQNSSQDTSAKSHSENTSGRSKDSSTADGQSNASSGKRTKKRRKHHSSSSCEMKLLNSTAQLVEPLESRKFARFSLSYTKIEEKPDGVDNWEPRFAGHQSLREREDSFIAHDQKINCGFVKGPKEYSGTGFDLAEDDYRYISKCHIAVISCIFGNSDRLRSPFTKAVSRLSRKNVCFVMFVDERTLQTLSAEGQMPDRMGYIGLWKVVVVKNLPFTDMRRVGKVPKLLSHRLFPSARYSIWLDSKLRLQRDPLLLLEHFLWRKGYEYAISNHYDRHCVWEEVVRNKKLNKFNHTMIDQQFQFYQADGLKRFNGSDPNKLLPSNVPEGSLIIRAHTPMSNLFSCLWFNEVDRFTPRDQLSFAYTYQKLRKKNPSKPFYLHMFKDCERRQIAKLFRHRIDEKRNMVQVAAE